jgi:hypothetical protein
MRKFNLLKLALLLAVAGLPCWVRPSLAQEGKPEKKAEEPLSKNTYRVEFTIKELDGNKQVNSRHYLMNVNEKEWGRVRSGSRVPVSYIINSSTQTQYQDVNMNIDCQPLTVGEDVQLGIKVEFTSLANPERAQETTTLPLLRQQQLNVTAMITPGKPTLVGSIDDVTSTHRFEIDVTATKVK